MARLRKLASFQGGQASLAEITGLSKSVISKYINGHSEPDRQRLLKIATATNVDIAWLVGGIQAGEFIDGSMDIEDLPSAEIPTVRLSRSGAVVVGSNDDDLIWLNCYGNDFVLFSGETDVLDGLIPETFKFPLSEHFLSVAPGGDDEDNIGVFLVAGDSMVPTLKDGEVIVVDFTQDKLAEGIHLIVNSDRLQIRRIRRPYGKAVELYSDNEEKYELETLDAKQEKEIKIVGRVIWHGRGV